MTATQPMEATCTTAPPGGGGVGVQDGLFDLVDERDGAGAVGYRGTVVCQITGVTYRQLDYWTRTGLVTASVTPAAGYGTQRLYSFRDILIIKIIANLLGAGLSLKAVRRALATLADLGIEDVAGTTLFCDGTTVYQCRSVDEVTDLLSGGQGVFGLAVPGLVADLSATITRFPSHHPKHDSAAATNSGGVAGDELATRRARRATTERSIGA
ncbi:DNA-binding transcriptional MerR regulator [Corynebacterium bovis DSM 20582 = CIP 54.80]|uniref:DNA-binding transcriptional MerR regulator n=2 Tax=Corynebacterium bovis TaxID=36808 RepID=A0A8I0CNP1_9CORY|nr:MerR family transcriptional regulator [Corynebacterium bovis]MBB3116935.1 DNA-binding transcriptional MerR regulator [Corynebacterium bovis DSM 20582 = CIP 54.80]MBB3116968.1 DNA-binding transcriptional MerR regulator [Corynebacterium bovis DSM 20582 = CIP 54.80]